MAKKDRADREDEMLDEGTGPRVYELGFHLDPELPTEEVKKTFLSIREAVEAVGSVVALADPQMVQLAYTISRQETGGRRDFNSAYFCWIVYECDASKHESVVSAAKAETRIIRFIDLLTTKDAARHAAEMRELEVKAPTARGAEPAAADAELDAALEGATL